MYTIKGSWVGQTFAMAKYNDNEGKKSRTRRSKEERKEMVVSFIRKYQSLNSGSFPSLNHTHKEVGGSFYIVREIVREIIQENKILGSGKHNAKNVSGEFPLGTIAMEPQETLSGPLFASSFTADRHQGLKGDSELVGSVSISENENVVVNEQTIDESFILVQANNNNDVSKVLESKDDLVPCVPNQVEDMETRESLLQIVSSDIDNIHQDLFKEKILIPEQHNVELLNTKFDYSGAYERNNLQNLVPVSNQDDSQTSYLSENSELIENEGLNSRVGDSDSHSKASLNGIVELFPQQNSMVCINESFSASKESPEGNDTEEECERNSNDGLKLDAATQCNDFIKTNSDGSEILIEPMLQNSTSMVNMATEKDANSSHKTLISLQDTTTALNNTGVETLPDDLLGDEDGIKLEAVDSTRTVNSNSESTSTHDHQVSKDILLEDEREKGTTGKSKLDRINIETWQDSSEQQIHPLLAIFKSFVAFFMRLFS